MDEWKKRMRNAYSRKLENDVVNEVLRIKAILDDDKSVTTQHGHSWALFNHLLLLEVMGLSSKLLHTTGIGFSVIRFRNHHHKPVRNIVSTILEQWRDKWPAVADGMEQKKQDDKEGGGDDVSNKKHIKPPPSTHQKQIVTTTKKNRPLVRILFKKVPINSYKENMITRDPNIPQQELKSLGVAHQLDTQNRMIQIISRKTNVPNRQAKVHEGEENLKRKALNMINKRKLDEKSCCSSEEEKLEATRRKLCENYKEAEQAKKKRKIQVIEFHELSKQGLLPKTGRQIKPRNTLIKMLRSSMPSRKTLGY